MTATPHPTRDESRKAVLAILRANPQGLTFKEIVGLYGRSASFTRGLVNELEAQGDAISMTIKRPHRWKAADHE